MRPSNTHTDMFKVVFSENAFLSLVTETRERITTETGGVFLGKVIGDTFYVVETLDPGPNSTFSVVYFEYDTPYVNHLANKVVRLYENKLDVIGLWHRHPGSLDVFSYVDDSTNLTFAKLGKAGAISALVNIDPTFRITMYHVSNPLSYEKIPYSVSSQVSEMFRKRSYTDVIESINADESGPIFNISFKDLDLVIRLMEPTEEDITADTSCTSEELVDVVMDDLDYLADYGYNPLCKYDSGKLILFSKDVPDAYQITLIKQSESSNFFLQYKGKLYPYHPSLLRSQFNDP